MGLQFQVGNNVFELRADSIIFYDGQWHEEDDLKRNFQIFSNGAKAIQSVEMTKDYVKSILDFFSDSEKRKEFELE